MGSKDVGVEPPGDLGQTNVQESRPPSMGVNRRLVASLLAATTIIVAGAVPGPAGTLGAVLGLTAMGATALTRDGRPDQLPLIAWLPVSFCLCVAGSAVLAMVGALSGISFGESTVVGALLIWLGFLIPAVVRGGRISVVAGHWPAAATVVAGLGFACWTVASKPLEVWTRAVSGSTDFPRHLDLTRAIATEGLDYATVPYPGGLHSWLALAAGPTGVLSFRDTWTSMEALLWLILTLTAVALVVVVTTMARAFGLPSGFTLVLGPVLVVITVLEGMWLSALFAKGQVTSLLMGLILAGVLAASCQSRFLGGRRAILVYTGMALCAAHGWPLLAPVVAVPVVLSAWLSFMRRRNRVFVCITVLVGLVAALPSAIGLLSAPYLGDGALGQLQLFGEVGLTEPDWWWLIAGLLAAFGVWSVRATLPGFALVWVLVAGGGMVTVLALILTDGTDWPHLGYYAIKSFWTLTVLLLAPAVAGAGVGVAVAWRAALGLKNRMAMVIGPTVVVAATCLVAVGIVGWNVGDMRTWQTLGAGGTGVVPLQIPLVDRLEVLDISAEPQQKAIVWGLAPYGDLRSMALAGAYDWFSSEATAFQGFDQTGSDELYDALAHRDALAVCTFLRQYPTALRITGPNPEAGTKWLIDSGCPERIVRTGEWIVVPVSDSWFVGLQEPGLPYTYPTYREFEDFKDSQQGRTPGGSDLTPPVD